MSENKKGFRAGLYAVIVFIIISAFLAVTVVTVFKTNYMGFHPDVIAVNYVDNIVQKGDGYDAYKYTVMSKNSKFGDFIIKNYMEPYINDSDDVVQSELTKTDDSEAKTKFYEAMYPFYTAYTEQYGYDDYDSVFSKYFEKAAQMRKIIYGDDYMTTDILFGAFESNVGTYGESLAGSAAIYDQYDTEKIVVEAKKGVYNKIYGDDYLFTTNAKSVTALDEQQTEAYIASMNSDMLKTYDITPDDIDAVSRCEIEVTNKDGSAVVSQTLYTVKIGNSWYVDNTTIDTSNLYSFYK